MVFCCVINLYGWREDALHEMTPVSLGTLSLSPYSTIYPWVFLLAHLSWKSFLITSCTNVHLSLSSSHFQLLPETLDWFQPNLAKSIFEWIAFKFIQMQHQAFQREDWMFLKILSRTKQPMIKLLYMLPDGTGTCKLLDLIFFNFLFQDKVYL